MYDQDHNGKFPAQWSEIYQYCDANGGSHLKLIVDPSCKERYHSWSKGYGYNAYLRGKNEADIDNPTVLLTVADSIRPETMITSLNDIDPRHDGGYVAGLCDGHAQYFKGVPARLK